MSSESDIEEEITETMEESSYIEDEELPEDIDISEEIKENLADPDDQSGKKEVPADKSLSTSQYVAIDNFSSTLAKSVLHEAILINEVYEKDKMNGNDKSLAVNAFDEDNEANRELNKPNGSYDSYIIEKFLQSKADPIEMTGEVGFDGKEEYFQTDEEQKYPGLDNGDVYIRGMRRSDTGRALLRFSILKPKK